MLLKAVTSTAANPGRESNADARDRVAITRDNSYLLIASGIKSLHTLWVALLRWAPIYL